MDFRFPLSEIYMRLVRKVESYYTEYINMGLKLIFLLFLSAWVADLMGGDITLTMLTQQ